MPKVRCKSVPAEGFCRGGYKWSHDGSLNEGVEVTDEQLAQLKAENLLHVEVLDATKQDAFPIQQDSKSRK